MDSERCYQYNYIYLYVRPVKIKNVPLHKKFYILTIKS